MNSLTIDEKLDELCKGLQVIKSTCESNGGKYVFIGDIYVNPANPETKKKSFTNSGVNAHPKDWSMREIASRLSASVITDAISK